MDPMERDRKSGNPHESGILHAGKQPTFGIRALPGKRSEGLHSQKHDEMPHLRHHRVACSGPHVRSGQALDTQAVGLEHQPGAVISASMAKCRWLNLSGG